MATKTFGNTLDADLMRHVNQARKSAGLSTTEEAKELTGAELVYTEELKPLTSVIPVEKIHRDIPLRVFTPDEWDESVRRLIPKVDKNFIFDPEWTFVAADAVMNDEPILTHGPKGSGKTMGYKQLAARMGIPFVRINCREDMESSAFMGSQCFTPELGVHWVDGPVPELARHGGILCIDEAAKMPAGIAAVLMPVLEKAAEIFLADKPGTSEEKTVTVHPWFRIVLTDNTELQGDTTGKYVSSNVQDEALIDRIESTHRLGYLKPAHEVKVITVSVPTLDKTLATRMVQLANLVRSSYDSGQIGFTMSPRGLVSWATKIARWGEVGRAFRASFFNKLTQDDQGVVAEHYRTVFGEKV